MHHATAFLDSQVTTRQEILELYLKTNKKVHVSQTHSTLK